MKTLWPFRHRRKPGDSSPLRNQSGQAMAEFTVFAPVLVIIFIAIMFFGKGYYLKQKCYSSARYCAWFTGRHVDEDQDYCRTITKNIAFAGEDENNITFNGPQGFGDIPDSFGLGTITAILSGLSQADKYMVGYNIEVPNILSFMGTERKPRNQHTVVTDCWNWLDPDALVSGTTEDSGVNDDDVPVDVP